MNQLTLFDLPLNPKPKPVPIDFLVGDRVVGEHIRSGQTISGTVIAVGSKYLELDNGPRAITIKTARRSLT
jgi:hypothetical protein